MALHVHQRRQRQEGPGGNQNSIANSIGNPGTATGIDGDIATAPLVTTFTTATGAYAIETTISGKLTTITSSGEFPITNSATFASIQAAESASRASVAAANTSPASSATAEASSGGGSSNLGTLIPAIVVPVIVVLLATFGAFWFWMRRRHRKELQNTDFAMAGKGEKLNSRSNSSRSGNSPGTAAEKASFVTTTEMAPPKAVGDQGPRDSYEAIGMARGMDHTRDDSHTRSPNMPFSGSKDQRQQQNFSGPRPSTAKNRPPPSRHEPQGRNRSNSSPGNRGPAHSTYRGPRGPPPPRDIGPSPIMRNHPSPQMGSGSARGPPSHSHPRAAPAPPGSGRLRDPSPTMATGLNRSNAPAALTTGAFNGASPISQYSPIVKETPNIGTVASFDNASNPSPPRHNNNNTNAKLPPIATSDWASNTGLGLAAIAVSKDNSRSPSPRSPEGSFLTEENMRIARLANSSRLGFNQTSKPASPGPGSVASSNALHPAVATRDFSKPLGFKKSGHDSPSLLPLTTAHSAPGQSPAATSTTNPSPKLPPPATYSQLIPSDSPRDERKPQWNYFGGASKGPDSPASSTYSGMPPHSRPLPASRNGPLPGGRHRDSNARNGDDEDDAKSEISDLDAYEDIDAKSDVSSLNEFERFDFDSRAGSARGSGSVRGGLR